jgi:hypothetical protein
MKFTFTKLAIGLSVVLLISAQIQRERANLSGTNKPPAHTFPTFPNQEIRFHEFGEMAKAEQNAKFYKMDPKEMAGAIAGAVYGTDPAVFEPKSMTVSDKERVADYYKKMLCPDLEAQAKKDESALNEESLKILAACRLFRPAAQDIVARAPRPSVTEPFFEIPKPQAPPEAPKKEAESGGTTINNYYAPPAEPGFFDTMLGRFSALFTIFGIPLGLITDYFLKRWRLKSAA